MSDGWILGPSLAVVKGHRTLVHDGVAVTLRVVAALALMLGPISDVTDLYGRLFRSKSEEDAGGGE